MARSLFGGRASDSIATLFTIGARTVLSPPTETVTLQVWSAPEVDGGTRLTDLLAADGTTPITAVTIPATANGQIPVFYGPDGVLEAWIRDPEGDFYRIATDTGTDAAAAEAARVAAEAARDSAVNISGISTSDDVVSTLITDPAAGPQTRSALSASIDARAVAKVASPRGGQRAKLERKPTLTVDQVFPNALVPDFTLLLAESSTVLWAVGTDTTLRKSTNGGATWAKTYYPGGLGTLGNSGLFFKTSAGSYLTTYHPFDLSAPKIMRSTDGVTWADVVAAQANVDYLGPTSICQDPVTGYLYLTEYVTATAATQATWKISRSTDDGATWTTFHTFQRDATANPTTAVRHGHGIQWDPVGQRIWFLCGDGEQAAGLYRVNAAGTGVEVVVTNSTLDNAAGQYAGAVGLMFFPNYVAWGVDQVSNSGLLRMARDQIGLASPAVTKVCDLQSTAFYTVCTKADYTEWLMVVSNENGAGGRLDSALHIYKVADDAATCDEALALPVSDGASLQWAFPVGGKVLNDGAVWLQTTESSPVVPGTGARTGYAIRVRQSWGAGGQLMRPDSALRKPFFEPVTVSSGNENLTASQAKAIGSTEAPPRATRLYILEVTAEKYSGDGAIYAEVYDQTGIAVLKMEDGVTNMQWQHRSRKAALQEASSPWIARSAVLSPGRQLRFRILNGLGGTTVAEGAVTITYAWGF